MPARPTSRCLPFDARVADFVCALRDNFYFTSERMSMCRCVNPVHLQTKTKAPAIPWRPMAGSVLLVATAAVLR